MPCENENNRIFSLLEDEIYLKINNEGKRIHSNIFSIDSSSYIDITHIVKRLDDLFLIKQGKADDNKMQCFHCGKIMDKSNFRAVGKGNFSTTVEFRYINTCLNCWDKITARRSLTLSMKCFFLKFPSVFGVMINEKDDIISEEGEALLNKIFTPEVIKLKTILLKLTNKLKEYDASKH